MPTHGLQDWSTKLRSQNMPVIGDVIAEINKLSADTDADANKVAEVILRDPNLTAHVLRVANSVHYNYSKTPISTVSRAIVNIGLKGMRAICISVLVVDSLMKGKPRERLLQLMAQGFHAGTQSRNLLRTQNVEDEEEVFIAGLLFNLGEMAFWSSENVDDSNTKLMSTNPKDRKEAMEEVLGTSFKSITRELSKHWKLGETLEQALFPTKEANERVKAVVLGERISRAALYGWDSPQLKKVLQEVADYTGMSLEESLNQLKTGGDQAAAVALDYGVSEACPLIPSSLKEIVLQPLQPKDKILKGDPALQLNILRDLMRATTDHVDVNTIFHMVLEGIHRGVGLERVCIAFIQGRRLVLKYMLGEGTDHWRDAFNFDIGPYADNVFCEVIEKGGSHWFDEHAIKTQTHLFPEDLTTIIGRFPCFVHLLEIETRKAALFYADRWNFGGQATEDQFESFRHFCDQAQMSLNSLSSATRSVPGK